MPASDAVSERSFSAMRRLYAYLRTNMGNNRLKNMMLLHIHKNRLDNLSLLEVANDFIGESVHRQTIFGNFDVLDLRRGKALVKSVGVQVNF